MNRYTAPLVALTTGVVLLIAAHPAQAHGSAVGGLQAGLSHPLLGLDHLLMLIAIGTAASFISASLLLWALAGAVIGAVIGFTGFSLPTAELLAALAISAVGLLTLGAARLARGSDATLLRGCSAAVVCGGLAIHALLHGLEAPRDSSIALWWAGALLSSVLVAGGSALLLRALPLAWTRAAAGTLVVLGGILALAPLLPGA